MSAESHSRPLLHRQIFCNRSLNMRSIRAIGYDMDYTLVHYNADAWERKAYTHVREKLAERGWPVGRLEFQPGIVARGLIIDRECGNILKANRFGYVKQAAHGLHQLSNDEKKQLYAREVVDQDLDRYVFLNTLFSLSEAVMYLQAVELLDRRALPEVLGYSDLYDAVRGSLDEAHFEGRLKSEILAHPDRFVEPDGTLIAALRDQKAAGMRLMVITNSDWPYTRAMLEHALDPCLPEGETWRDLFELVIASARKPEFFTRDRSPAFEVVDDAGLLRPVPGGIAGPGNYVGGCAAMVERYMGLDGSEVLFVGDHLYADVRASKGVRRWRTALILRELEAELAALQDFAPRQQELTVLVQSKEHLESQIAWQRLSELARSADRTDEGSTASSIGAGEIAGGISQLREELAALDRRIEPLAARANTLHNPVWGPIMRAGHDKSYLARQLEQYADVYTSRASNFRFATPFAYFRSPYGSLPHDPGPGTILDSE